MAVQAIAALVILLTVHLSRGLLPKVESQALAADDECTASDAAGCALEALQLRSQKSQPPGDEVLEAVGSEPSDAEMWDKYHRFLKQYNRQYSEQEEKRRFENFKASYFRANKQNVKNGLGAKVFGINNFADFDARELPKKGLTLDLETILGSGLRTLGSSATPEGKPPAAHPDPPNINWRLTKAITPVKNQGTCGACWAFAAAEEVEAMYTLWKNGGKSGYMEIFSVQQLASCVSSALGCGGGNPINAWKYLERATGLAQEEYWPYQGGLLPEEACQEQSCTKPCDRDLENMVQYEHIIGPYATITGALWATPLCQPGSPCGQQNLEMLRRVLVELGPVAVAVNSNAWYDYNGGVLTAKGCEGSSWNDLDHAAQLTGYNTSSDLPYWIVRNQWSTSWGEHGYIYLEYGKNTCGIANMASLPLMEGMPDIQGLGDRISVLQEEASSYTRPPSFERHYKQAIGELPADSGERH